MKSFLVTFFLAGILAQSCAIKTEDKIKNITDVYYQTFEERKDFEKFLAFYDDDIILEDIINGDRIKGKEALKQFFDWNNPHFELLETNNLVINGNYLASD